MERADHTGSGDAARDLKSPLGQAVGHEGARLVLFEGEFRPFMQMPADSCEFGLVREDVGMQHGSAYHGRPADGTRRSRSRKATAMTSVIAT